MFCFVLFHNEIHIFFPSGQYRVRLCNQGIWQVVTIDDLLPVSASNSLVFSRSKKKQLFAPLIEKALAKMHGSYMALKSGKSFYFPLMIDERIIVD